MPQGRMHKISSQISVIMFLETSSGNEVSGYVTEKAWFEFCMRSQMNILHETLHLI